MSIGWVGFILSVGGAFLAARKNAWCWPCWIFGCIFFGVYAYDIKSWPMFFQQLVFLCINIYGMLKWNWGGPKEPMGGEGW